MKSSHNLSKIVENSLAKSQYNPSIVSVRSKLKNRRKSFILRDPSRAIASGCLHTLVRLPEPAPSLGAVPPSNSWK